MFRHQQKMVEVKITNCCYYRGGAKCPLRIRKYQNVTLLISENTYKKYLDGKSLSVNLVWYLTDGKYRSTSTSKIIKL